MPPRCNVNHPVFPGVACTGDRDHTDDHRNTGPGGTVTWPREIKQQLSVAQLKAKMVNQRAELKASQDSISGVHNAVTDSLNTVLPIFVEQLDIIEGVFALLVPGKDDK